MILETVVGYIVVSFVVVDVLALSKARVDENKKFCTRSWSSYLLKRSPSQHWQIQLVTLCTLFRFVIAGVNMAHYTCAGIVPQHAADARGCLRRAIADDDHTRMLGVSHPDPATVMKADPRRAASRTKQGV
jgi:hypothetical protein